MERDVHLKMRRLLIARIGFHRAFPAPGETGHADVDLAHRFEDRNLEMQSRAGYAGDGAPAQQYGALAGIDGVVAARNDDQTEDDERDNPGAMAHQAKRILNRP